MLWLDGALQTGSVAPFDLADRGLLLGDGVFDTSLVLGGTMVWRSAHLRRLADACEALGFSLDGPLVNQAIDALVATTREGVLRITVTHGPGPRGLAPPKPSQPTIIAAIAPLRGSFFAPVSLHVTAIRRNESSPASRLKTLSYLDAIFASQEARRDGFDDALFLNTKGHVACASVGNVLALEAGRLVTPPLEDGILAGITRATLLRLCATVGLEPVERSLTLDDLAQADAVFVSNSLRLFSPVRRVGAIEKPVPCDLRCAALIAALSVAVRQECGTDPRHVAARERASAVPTKPVS